MWYKNQTGSFWNSRKYTLASKNWKYCCYKYGLQSSSSIKAWFFCIKHTLRSLKRKKQEHKSLRTHIVEASRATITQSVMVPTVWSEVIVGTVHTSLWYQTAPAARFRHHLLLVPNTRGVKSLSRFYPGFWNLLLFGGFVCVCGW